MTWKLWSVSIASTTKRVRLSADLAAVGLTESGGTDMKQTILKLLLLALYVGLLQSLSTGPVWSGGMALWSARLVLGYCGLIVLAQLLSTFIGWSGYLLAIGRENREASVSSRSVAYQTETEAT